MNKKFVLLFVFVIVMSGLFLVSSFMDGNKVSDEVYDALEENAEVRVLIKLKEVGEKKGLFIKIAKSDEEISVEEKEIKENVIRLVGKENVKHDFGNEFSLDVSIEKLDDLKKNDNVEHIYAVQKIKPLLQDSVGQINASAVFPVNLFGNNVTGIGETICVIDTGVNYSHPDLGGCTSAEFTAGNCAKIIGGWDYGNNDNDPIDVNGHGTHVAGIAAANGSITGVAPGAKIVALKVFTDEGIGSTDMLKSAIDWCVANVSVFNISVITMSIGVVDGENNEVPYNAYCDSEYDGIGDPIDITGSINSAVAANISVTISSGNDLTSVGELGNITAPACIENATAVGSINNDVTFNYNRNSLTDFVAPGVSINSTGGPVLAGCSAGGNYMVCSGTSMAAPHVAGAFVLFRQFFRLQNGRDATVSEVGTTFNSTAKQINDSFGTNLNYSRIDVFAAVQSIDVSNPVVSLSSPVNETVQFVRNVTFNCSANDVQLDNITLYVWNSSGVFNDSVVADVGGVNGALSGEIVNMSYGDYEWNCLAYDENGNFSFASFNYSLTIGQIITSLDTPANNSFVNVNQTYNCSAETEPTKELENITFYAWNSSGDLVYNVTENVSGAVNSSLFYFNFTTEQEYSWNCLGYNNESESDWGDVNFTITYDITNPNLTITSSPGSATFNSIVRSFGFNVSDTNLANCSLIVGSAISLTNSSINQSVGQSFSKTFTPGTYAWSINCSDYAGNVNGSLSSSFTITAAASSGSPGGSTGSTISSSAAATPVGPVVHDVSTSEVSGGYTKSLKKGDKVNFSIFDFEGGRHLLTVDEVGVDYVNLTIESDPIKLVLGVGQSVRLNLTSPNYYDLFIKLNNITNGSAELTIQLINEPIEAVVVVEKEVIVEKEVEGKDYFWVVIVLVVILVVIVFVVVRANKGKKLKGKKTKKKNGKGKKVEA